MIWALLNISHILPSMTSFEAANSLIRGDRWKSYCKTSHNWTRHHERSIEFTRLSWCVRPQIREKNCFSARVSVWERESGLKLVGKFSEFSTRFSSKNSNGNEIFLHILSTTSRRSQVYTIGFGFLVWLAHQATTSSSTHDDGREKEKYKRM